jgi:hypothetical protein
VVEILPGMMNLAEPAEIADEPKGSEGDELETTLINIYNIMI